MPLPDYIESNDNIVLFDGECVLCTGWAKFLLKYDKRMQFKLASVQSGAGQDLLRYADLPVDEYETLVLLESGTVYLRSTAVIRILGKLSLPWSLIRLFKPVPRKLRDIVYHHIAIRRYALFGKRDECYVPNADELKRFIQKPSHV